VRKANPVPCMREDPEDRKVTCALPRGHNVRRRPCSWQRTNRVVEPVSAHTIREFAPRRGEIPSGRSIAHAVSDARTREVELRVSIIERDLAALREPPTSAETLDPRKLFIRAFTARHPGVPGRAIALGLDNAELRPLPSWIKATGLRLWHELWDCKTHPKTRRAVRKWVYDEAELSPLVTASAREGP